jgi:hypothetical protein
MALDATQQQAMLRTIAAWRANPKRAAVACPVCGEDGLSIIDRSARPYAEWYALSCAACGLRETLHVALGPSVPTLD